MISFSNIKTLQNKRIAMLFIFLSLLSNFLSLFLHFTVDFLKPTPAANLATSMWVASMLFLVLYLSSLPKDPPSDRIPLLTPSEKLFMGVMLIGALFLRMYKIDHLGLDLDEWFWLTHASAIVAGAVRSPFGFIGDQPSNLPAFFVAAVRLATADPFLAVRLPSVLYGLGTMIFLFSFLRSAYNKYVALLSALFLSLSIWDIRMSQLVWHNVAINPFLISGALLFLYRGIKFRSHRNMLLCGIFFGFSINLLYIAALSIAVGGITLILYFLINKQKWLIATLSSSLILATFITSSPTIAKISRYPEQSILRHQIFLQENIEKSKRNQGVWYYVQQVKLGIYDLFFTTEKYRAPSLWGIVIEPPTLFLFVIGFIWVLRTAYRLPSFLLLLSYGIMFIPIVLLNRATSIWREYGFVPSIYGISALGGYALAKGAAHLLARVVKNRSTLMRWGVACVVISYILFWIPYYIKYRDIVLAAPPHTHETSCKTTSEYIKKHIPADTVILLPDELCAPLVSIMVEDTYRWRVYQSPEQLQDLLANSGPTALVVILFPYHARSIDPNTVRTLLTTLNRQFQTHTVKRDEKTVYSIIYQLE